MHYITLHYITLHYITFPEGDETHLHEISLVAVGGCTKYDSRNARTSSTTPRLNTSRISRPALGCSFSRSAAQARMLSFLSHVSEASSTTSGDFISSFIGSRHRESRARYLLCLRALLMLSTDRCGKFACSSWLIALTQPTLSSGRASLSSSSVDHLARVRPASFSFTFSAWKEFGYALSLCTPGPVCAVKVRPQSEQQQVTSPLTSLCIFCSDALTSEALSLLFSVARENTTIWGAGPYYRFESLVGVIQGVPRGGEVLYPPKRVIVTPTVYPRLIEFLHFDIQSTGQKSHCVNTE